MTESFVPSRIVNLTGPGDGRTFTVAVVLPEREGVEWFVHAIPVDTALLDDPARTPMQVALDVGQAAKEAASDVIHPAVVERRRTGNGSTTCQAR